MPDRDWSQALWPKPAEVLEQVGVAPGMRVVDLCSGDGYFTVPMSSIVGAGSVHAVELDETMLATAKGVAQNAGAGNITFIHGDAMKVGDLIDDAVDLVMIANTFHGAPDHAGLARAVRRTLEPGGTFVVVNWWPKPREETIVLGKPRGPRRDLRFSPQQVAAWVEPVGFQLIRVEEVGPYHYGAVFTATDAAP
ncbi:MAG: class I SAM-dependent methyltransferase [Nannocystales bacterium]